jgi:polysaccharide pyruvyl transferase CsaB
VVLCGNQGYLGILNQSNLSTAIETNFTCRGCDPLTPERLAADLNKLINMPVGQRKAMGRFNRKVIQTHFSLARMADDAIAMYDEVMVSSVKGEVVISGYYGYNNSGDDMLLESIVGNLRLHRPGISITVLSKRPKETRAQYGVLAIRRFNFLAVYLCLKKARLLVTGGGNLLQDETSTQSLLYYLWVINTARRLHVKNMLYAKGIGPVSKASNIARVRNALNKVDLITLREEEALRVLRDIGVYAPQTHVTADAAFAVPPADNNVVAPLLAEMKVTGPYFCVSLRGWVHNPPQLEQEVARYADYMVSEYKFKAVFVPMRPVEDEEISRRVMGMMKNPAVLIPSSQKDINAARVVVGNGAFVLGMRLHSLVYALEMGVPMIGLVYSAKVRQYMEYMDLPWHMALDEVELDRLIKYTDEIMADKDNISAKITETGRIMRERAELNAELCVGLLGGY